MVESSGCFFLQSSFITIYINNTPKKIVLRTDGRVACWADQAERGTVTKGGLDQETRYRTRLRDTALIALQSG